MELMLSKLILFILQSNIIYYGTYIFAATDNVDKLKDVCDLVFIIKNQL